MKLIELGIGVFLAGEEDFGTANHGVSFVSLDDVNREGRFGRDINVLVVAKTSVVFCVVEVEVKIAEARDDIAADFSIAFADCGGEDESINALHGSYHLADGSLDAVNIHVVSQLGTGVISTGFDNLPQVAADTADA